MTYKTKQRLQISAIIVLLLLFQVANVYLAQFAKGPVFPVFDNVSVCGIITVLQVMFCAAMISVDWKHMTKIAIGFAVFSLISCLISIFASNNYSSIPGAVTMIAGIGLMFFLAAQLKKRDYEANYDLLTGIPNRRYFINQLKIMASGKEPFYLMYLDLDSFKMANDKFGHDAGDAILKATADYWSSKIRKEDMIARIGGDEFCAIVPAKKIIDIDDYIGRFTNNLMQQRVETPSGKLVNLVDVSIGVVKYPDDSDTSEELLKRVDYAMYEAKRNAATYCTFNKEIEDQIEKTADVEMLVKNALDEKKFYMVYQPQYEAKTKKLRGFEALIRLRDNDGNSVPPSMFIPIIETTGLILEVDDFVIKRTLNEFSSVVNMRPEAVLSLNISAIHICDPNFADYIKEALEDSGFPSKNLEMEITEYSYVQSQEIASLTISKLKELGVKIALDDFGTGYSSMAMFSSLPLDIIKIDKSLIEDIATDSDKELLVRKIIEIGHMFNFKVLSEGIEEKAQLDILKDGGCDYIQGYYWGYPETCEKIIAHLNEE